MKKTSSIVLLLTVLVGVFLWVPVAYAAEQAQWIDSANIKLGEDTYTDVNPIDDKREFYKGGQDSDVVCADAIREVNGDNTAAKLHIRRLHCETVHKADITFSADSVANASKEPSSTQPKNDSCESKGVLGWILCPVIELLDGLFNFFDRQIQGLLGVNEDSFDTNNESGKKLQAVWARLRNIAYLILIPVMMVMVIGTAMGTEMFSAYTVKKALPRMVVAVIFISLSWQICTFLIKLFNVIGGGILGLMTSPFGLNGNITLGDLFTPSFGGLVVQTGGAAIGAKLIAAFASKEILGIVFSLLGLAALFIGIAFAVLTIRQLFILALLLVSPLAILAWIFPGNDKLWKGWWSLFSKLLIMFPLIMVVIGMGRVFAYLIGNTGGGTLQGNMLNPVLKILAYVLPYAFIPFTFKFAGGVFATISGAMNDRSKGLFDRMKKGRHARYERVGRQVLQKRADRQYAWQQRADNTNLNPLRRQLYKRASRMVGGYNVQAADSARRAAVGKEINDQINTGRDDEIRGLTVDKQTAQRRVNADGIVQYKSLGGRWINESAIDEGQRRWGSDTYAQQAALSYEMRKASTEEELQNLAANYHNVARAWGMTDEQAEGTWIGAAFENQNQHLEFKHTDWRTGRITPDKAQGFATEIYEKKGSYALSQMSSNTIDALKVAYDQAAATGDFDTQKKIQATAEMFMSRYGGAPGAVGAEDEGARADAIARAAGGPVTPSIQTVTPGAAHVAERVRQLAVHTGVYQAPLPDTNTRSDVDDPSSGRPAQPPPYIPRQS